MLGFSISILVMPAPLAMAASSGNISNTGPDSHNTIVSHSSSSNTVTNNNNVSISNSSSQTANSGDASVYGNTRGGSATSGNASNKNQTNVSVRIKNTSSLPTRNSSSGNYRISNTGPDSKNIIKSYNNTYVNITNNNNVSFSNTTTQAAATGDAKVAHNTRGGSATSGNASNKNETNISVRIHNHSSKNSCHNKRPSGGQGSGPTIKPSNNQGGKVLGLSLAVASVGGQGTSIATLPNTGLHDGIDPWIAVTILTVLASIIYWNLAITPKLKKM